MRGYQPYPYPANDAARTWEGQRVNRNGTNHNGTVLRATYGGTGQAVKLTVDWDRNLLSLSALTDSEHVTIIKESNNG
jgi:hypothetical protein